MFFILFAQVLICVSIFIVGIYWFKKRLTERRVRRVDVETGGCEQLVRSNNNNQNRFFKKYLFPNTYANNSFTMVYLRHEIL